MFKTLGEALFSQGFRRSVWVSFENINKHEFGIFDPSAPLLDFPRRYGSAKRKGDLVGERYARFIVEDVIRHPSNPLGLESNQSYTLREGEEYDAKMVTTGGDIACYDSFFRPAHRSLFETPGTTTPRPPVSTTPPPTTVPPVTTPAPGGVTPEPQRVEELRSLLRDALSGFQDSNLRPGLDKLVSSELTSLALLRAVQVYRKIMR